MIIPIAFLTGVAIGVLIGSIMGYECGTANGVREERTRVAQEIRK